MPRPRKNRRDLTERNLPPIQRMHTQLANLIVDYMKLAKEVHQLAPRVTALEQRFEDNKTLGTRPYRGQ